MMWLDLWKLVMEISWIYRDYDDRFIYLDTVIIVNFCKWLVYQRISNYVGISNSLTTWVLQYAETHYFLTLLVTLLVVDYNIYYLDMLDNQDKDITRYV